MLDLTLATIAAIPYRERKAIEYITRKEQKRKFWNRRNKTIETIRGILAILIMILLMGIVGEMDRSTEAQEKYQVNIVNLE